MEYKVKNINSLHVRISPIVNECLITGDTPSWLTKGRTVLIIKDKTKGNEVTNYRPISCLLVMWRLFTRIILEEIYQHQDISGLLPEEQKGCKKRIRGTKDQLLMTKPLFETVKNGKSVWQWAGSIIKAFDIIPHS